ncbi:hypothetical protein JCM33374_g410 [Metschnikowia sp. JCM 33374]|nr:hypothetical protein JCM33374_g410 [Metschnikowia sp. JCM 33374]
MLSSLVNRLLKRPATAALEPVKATKRKYTGPSIFKPLVWIDCEMTGLDISKDHIIEICCIITDGNLNIIDADGYESTVYVPKKTLDNMNEWCVTHHGESGLTAKILANPQQTLAKVQQELLEYIQSYISEPRTSLLAGNSVHMDKFFMMKEFPQVIDHLHYRLVDVSSIMEIGYRHNPSLMKLFPKKKGAHTAKSDILESIEQLRWYRDNYLRSDIPHHLNVGKGALSTDTEHVTKKAKLSPSTQDLDGETEIKETESASEILETESDAQPSEEDSVEITKDTTTSKENKENVDLTQKQTNVTSH